MEEVEEKYGKLIVIKIRILGIRIQTIIGKEKAYT